MSKKIEMIGKRFGNLVVIAEGEKSTNHREFRWICRCDCGNITQSISGFDLRSGHTKSCGCLHLEKMKDVKTTHGKSSSRLYHIWQNMRARCNRPSSQFYSCYGGRGITVCEEWRNSFETFYEWAMANGYSDDLTIDRINNDGNYEPSNCRWATQERQNRNTRKNVFLSVNGITKTISEWAKETGVSYSTISWRYKQGVTGIDLIKPTKKRKVRI